jgi:hypothetical protein
MLNITFRIELDSLYAKIQFSHFSITMKSIYISIIFVLSLVLFIAGCSKPKIDPDAYAKEITAWQEKRAKSISSENGWITLAGLFWLKPGENTFGSDSTNAIILPKSIPAFAGTLFFKDGAVSLTAREGVDVRIDDSLRAPQLLRSDADTAGPSVVSIGSVSFYVIQRANQTGVRVKDKQNPARLNFTGLKFFPINLKWRVQATFEKYPAPEKMPVATVIGTVDTFACPGEVKFTLNDKELRLVAMIEPGSDGELYFMLSDETSGKETYGAGRQLYSSLPDSAGNVTLDFNKTINWPCAYTSYATCPIPPSKNHLAVRIEAGEMNYPGHKD